MSISIHELLSRVDSRVEVEVRLAMERMRQTLREAVKAETGLSMRWRGDDRVNSAQVPIEVCDGCPESLAKVDFPDDLEPLLFMADYRDSLVNVETSVEQLIVANKKLRSFPAGSTLSLDPDDPFYAVRDWVVLMLSRLSEIDPVLTILNVHEDVLGTYTYERYGEDPFSVNRASIQLYWPVIGFVAKRLGCTVENLTGVVLIHELSHAYTQLGADIGGMRWPSENFANAEVTLKEGLAQYFTAKVVSVVSGKYPSLQDAYTRLLSKQSDTYKVHIPWIEQVSPEAVRLAMIEVRRQGERALAQFETRLNRASSALCLEPVGDRFGRVHQY
jgi:hypothetical protein